MIYSLLVAILLALGIIYFRLDNSIEDTSDEILSEKSKLVHRELDNFFLPIENKLQEEWFRLSRGEFDGISSKELVRHFFSTIQSNPLISGCFISDEHGNHMYASQLKNRTWFSSQIFRKEQKTESLIWQINGTEISLKQENLKDSINYDPREKKWFKNSLNSDTIVWTPPYDYDIGAVTDITGITVSKKLNPKDSVTRVISFDVTLTDLSNRTSEIKVGEHGFAFVVLEQGELVGLPNLYKELMDTLQMKNIGNVKDSEFPVLSVAFESFEKSGKKLKNYMIEVEGEAYVVNFSAYRLNGISLYAATVLPRKDIIQSISSTRVYLLYAMGFILLVILIIAHVYRRRNILHGQLQIEKANVDLQHKIVEEKNKEIIDSINYAKRIQKAILPPSNQVEKVLKAGFVLYEPKDIVAGDFYWINELSADRFFFAACDCTGHGVPGAMVSVICNNGLNRSVNEFGIQHTGELLDKTREIVVKEFEKSEDEVKDGMDLSLVKIEKKGDGKMSLQFSGANNPLWIIRKGSDKVESHKGTKQPIGKVDNPQKFEAIDLELEKGDRIYLFTDGYADQFGGEKGKKMKANRFQEFLLSIQSLEIAKQEKELKSFFTKWKGNLEQIDDVCVIGFEVE